MTEDAVQAPMTDIPLSDEKESEAHLMNSTNTTANENQDAEDSNPDPDTSLTKQTNQNDENDLEKGDNPERDESLPAKRTGCCRKGGSCYKMFGGFIILYNGWKTYMKNQVALAGIGLACLYLTVLGFDNITTGGISYLYCNRSLSSRYCRVKKNNTRPNIHINIYIYTEMLIILIPTQSKRKT